MAGNKYGIPQGKFIEIKWRALQRQREAESRAKTDRVEKKKDASQQKRRSRKFIYVMRQRVKSIAKYPSANSVRLLKEIIDDKELPASLRVDAAALMLKLSQ